MTDTIGEQLKQARLQRGLTLEQAAQATHIRKQFLEALENDQRDALPSKVQGRGFLRLYAGLLNLEPGPLLAVWEDNQVAPPASPPTIEPPAAEDSAAEPENVSAEAQDVVTAPAPMPAPPAEQALPVDAAVYSAPDASSHSAATGSPVIFQEIGRQLRQQREALGLSLAEVERYTRLRAHYILALEEGRLGDLPSPVQGRGMLSNYAAFLNLDEEKVLLRFAEGLQIRRVERIPKPDPQSLLAARKRPARQAPFWRRFLTPDLIFGVGVAAIILFFALWTAARITAQSAAETVPTPPGVAEILLTPVVRTTTPNPNETAIAGESLTLTPGPEDSNSGAEETDNDLLEQLPVIQISETPGGTPTLPAMNRDPLQIYIIARQRAWMRVTADDKVKFLGRTVPGNAYAYSAVRRIELSTGNAAALQVFYNQTDLGVLGSSGEVASLIFSEEGYVTPTAAFTATASPAPSATMTPLPSATPQATATITPLIP